MKTPSSHWIANLIRLIQECHAETDTEFIEYLHTLGAFEKQKDVAGMHVLTDYQLVTELKKEWLKPAEG